MNIQMSDTVGSIVKQDIRAAKIFNNYNLDFCCDGDKTLELICKESNVSLGDVMRELRELEEGGRVDSPDFDSMKLDDLTLYIENVHHRYTADSVSFIKMGLEKLVRVHSVSHPEVVVVKRIFDDMAGHLTVHMKKEELMLFPFVRKLARFGEEAMRPLRLPQHRAPAAAGPRRAVARPGRVFAVRPTLLYRRGRAAKRAARNAVPWRGFVPEAAHARHACECRLPVAGVRDRDSRLGFVQAPSPLGAVAP